MSNMLTSISGYFNKALILGAFFPTVIFFFLSLVFLVPLFPVDLPLAGLLHTLDPTWQALATTLLTAVLSGLLYYLNGPIVRTFEGYSWQNLWGVGDRAEEFYRQRLILASAQKPGIRALLGYLRDQNDGDRRDKVTLLRRRLEETLFQDYPGNEGLVLPTKLGNILRSFEDYSTRMYGIDAISIWPRLAHVIDKDYAAAVDDAETAFNFMLNCSVLSGLLALMITAVGSYYSPTTAISPGWLSWIAEIVIFVIASCLFYNFALTRARTWGDMVRGVFDLYRWDLLEKLGYQQKPRTVAAEKDLWNKISTQIIYGYPASDIRDPLPYSDPAAPTSPVTPRVTKPTGAEVSLTRATTAEPHSELLSIVIALRNNGSAPLHRVVVVDAVPDGFDYVWGSAISDGKQIQVSGINPYEFTLDELPAESDKATQITYDLRPRRPRTADQA